MLKRVVLVSKPAIDDIHRIVNYIRLDKPVAAEKFKRLLEKKMGSLQKMAKRGRKIPELKNTPFHDYRELIVNPCRILYRVTLKEVRVLRVLHVKHRFEL